MPKTKTLRLLWALPVAAFFLNPSFACGPGDPEYQYGAAEMRAAVEGNWSFALQPSGSQETLRVTVKVEQSTGTQAWRREGQANLIRRAHACGTRTLVKSAAACIDQTQMPLKVTFVSGDPAFADKSMSGSLTVHSLKFTEASSYLDLKLGDYVVNAQLTPRGMLVNPRLSATANAGTLTEGTRL